MKRPLDELEQIRQNAEGDANEVDRFTRLLRDGSGGIYIRGVTIGSPLAAVPMDALTSYIEEFVGDAIRCDPRSNPLLRSLAEQLVLAHHTIGRLQCEAMESKDPETRRVNMQLAISLLGELRRLSKEICERVASSKGHGLQVAAVDEPKEKAGGRQRTA